MKATELRLGNWVSGDSIKPYQIELSDFSDWYNDHNSHTYGDYVHPIPLTEEWLLKFGFQMIDHSGTHFWSKDIEFDNGDHPDLYLHFHIKDGEIVNSGITSGEIDNEDGYEGERTHLVNTVEYVHQLQNLYYALTGEELQESPLKLK